MTSVHFLSLFIRLVLQMGFYLIVERKSVPSISDSSAVDEMQHTKNLNTNYKLTLTVVKTLPLDLHVSSYSWRFG